MRPCASARSAVRRAIARYEGSTSGAERASVRTWLWTVATSPRDTGPVRAASRSRNDVVERRAEQRRDQPRRVLHADAVEQVERVVDQRDEVVRAQRQRRVVERPRRLRHPHRLAAHLEHERLGDRAQLVRRGDAEGRAVEPVEVLGASGEGHHRVQGQGDHAPCRRGVEHADALRAGGVRDELARRARRRCRRARPPAGAGRRRARRAARTRRRRPSRRPPARGTPGSICSARRRDAADTAADRHDVVPGAGERRPQRAAHPSRRRRRPRAAARVGCPRGQRIETGRLGFRGPTATRGGAQCRRRRTARNRADPAARAADAAGCAERDRHRRYRARAAPVPARRRTGHPGWASSPTACTCSPTRRGRTWTPR